MSLSQGCLSWSLGYSQIPFDKTTALRLLCRHSSTKHSAFVRLGYLLALVKEPGRWQFSYKLELINVSVSRKCFTDVQGFGCHNLFIYFLFFFPICYFHSEIQIIERQQKGLWFENQDNRWSVSHDLKTWGQSIATLTHISTSLVHRLKTLGTAS